MSELSSYKSDHIPRFRGVFEKWIQLNENYCRVSRWKDIPWGYIERASVSVFAGACWSSGGIALEEYSELKKLQNGRAGKAETAPGRCDLYVAFKNRAYIFEAKMVRPSLAGSNWRLQILRDLRKARDDVRRTHAPNGERKLGLLIVAPTIPRNRAAEAGQLIERFVDFLNSRDDMCSAWFFPEKVRDFSWNNEKQRAYPGTAVLVKALRS